MHFQDCLFITAGTHGCVVKARDADEGRSVCIKLFRQRWIESFNQEKTAYELLKLAGVEDCIPDVYGYDCRTLVGWGLVEEGEDASDDLYYGIVMEWLEGGEQVSIDNINLDNACKFIKGLNEIHGAGVLHDDLYLRNIMVLPRSNRAVFVDFSCAQVSDKFTWEFDIIIRTILSLVLRPFFMADRL